MIDVWLSVEKPVIDSTLTQPSVTPIEEPEEN
jgi:hypothetical protein